MPAAVERCVSSLLAKWKKDPSSRPAAKDGKTAEEQAWAICNAAQKRGVQNSLAEMLDLEDSGAGPALIGAAATNRPFIPKLKATRIIEEDGKKKLQVHLANSGYFNHPTGPFVLNRAVFLTMINNFEKKVVGQDAAYDCRHKPDEGAYGWFEKLMLGDEIGEGEKEFWGLVDPTSVGLERIEGGEFKYSSMEFHRNYNRSDVTLDLEDATLDFCVVELEQPEKEEIEEEVDDTEDVNMSDEKETVSLEDYQKAQDELEKIKAEKKAAEDRAEKATQSALKLQQDAIKTEVAAVVNLAQSHRDKDGNALPRQMVEWVQKFLSLEEIGTDDNIVRLEEGDKVSLEFRKYLIGSVRNLILEMPGVVPAERQSHSGSSGDEDEDEQFDFDSLWEEEK